VKYYHTKSDNRKSFSLLIVPHSKSVKQVTLLTWIPRFFLSLILITIIVTSYFTWNLYDSYTNLRNDYDIKIGKLNSLENINKQQKVEIDNLKNKTSEIEEKLRSITELQETVKSMVGLKESDENNSMSTTSRGGVSRTRMDLQPYEITTNLENQIDELSELLDKSTEDLSDLIGDVEERLEYLDAKPNMMPTSGRVTSGFGNRKNPFGRGTEFHPGLDIANNSGTKVKAAGSGVVTFAGYNGGYGRVVIINHGYGYQSVYAHNKTLKVKVGDRVEKGQLISLMGSTGRSTGPHLHFEIRYYGNPINPYKVLNNVE